MTNRSFQILAVCAALAAPALTSTHEARAQAAGAQGQSSQKVDAAALAKARETFQQANKLYDEGKFPQAERLYEEAWKIKKSYDLAGNYGNLLADMAKPRPAAMLLSFAIKEFPAGGKPALREALVKRLGEVKRLIGTLRVTVNAPRADGPAPKADIYIDGHQVENDDEIYVDPSLHTVEARADGYMPASEQITAHKGKTVDVSLTLVPPKGANKGVLVAGSVIAGVSILTGAVLLGVGASKSSTISGLQSELKATGGCPTDTTGGKCEELRSAASSRTTLGSAGVGMLVGGAAVGVATIIYAAAASGKAPPRTGLRVLPVVTGDSGGLWLSGAF